MKNLAELEKQFTPHWANNMALELARTLNGHGISCETVFHKGHHTRFGEFLVRNGEDYYIVRLDQEAVSGPLVFDEK